MTKKIVASVLVLALVIVGSVYLFGNNPNNVVAKVNGKPVTKKELKFFMLLNKAKVYNYFYRAYKIDYDASFWHKRFQGRTTPLQRLKRKALDEAVRFKVQQLLARRKGISVTTDFNDLMHARKKLNNVRKNKVKESQPVYGPVSLSPRNYIQNRRDKIIQYTKYILTRGDFKISQKEMKRLYNNYISENDSYLKGNNSGKLHSFKSFEVLYQNKHTNDRYKKLIDKLQSKANLKINDTVYNKIDVTAFR